ncbi:NAD-dependent epimerase/dehydratase family protein [Photobacterium sp.]|uniref:NAD-dependent epimerase/dehydratase family protein n=1 Tax=Photobacterium sp. TaxID=660 RepID=UPI00299F224E|nr:NAD(P)H-binding protein [Photobacterium sp.]MDX1303725.1 oxidoreductase [Photobacterium sp.]
MSQVKASAIIAGASGLVGDELLHLLLAHDHFQRVYSLSRRELPFHSKKLVQIIHPELRITAWDESDITPTYGFICLGTTKKQAGSNAALEAVDFQLVKDVATTMQLLGVTNLVVISSLFAHPWSPSHYLRSKGKMEKALSKLGFSRCTFVRPGPLKGERSKPRHGEIISQRIFALIKPLLVGPLAHLNPIPAEDVARSMLALSLEHKRVDNHSVRIVAGKSIQPHTHHSS